MPTLRLLEKLVFDLRFLLWRAQIHHLSDAEVESRYRQLAEHYLALSEQSQLSLVRQELDSWAPLFHRQAG